MSRPSPNEARPSVIAGDGEYRGGDDLGAADNLAPSGGTILTFWSTMHSPKRPSRWLSRRSFVANAIRFNFTARLYSREFHTGAGNARDSGAVVTDEPTGEPDQDRRQRGEPCSRFHIQMAEVAVPRQIFRHIP